MNFYIFLTTVANIDEGKKIARVLVKEKFAACVNIIQNVYSIYEWKENVEEEVEYLLIIKTTEDKSDFVIQKIKEIHSYDLPECIGFKIDKGSEKYLSWINKIVS
jgi:periplasmic divalent cation tolerance protein